MEHPFESLAKKRQSDAGQTTVVQPMRRCDQLG
jgi:hypothetical protein